MSDKRAASASAWQGRLFILLSAVCWSMGGLLVKSSVWSGLSIAIYRGVISFAAFRLMLGHPLRRPDRMTLSAPAGRQLCKQSRRHLLQARRKSDS